MAMFMLRTHDEGWIQRHNGTVDHAGRVAFEVDAVEEFTHASVAMLRTRLDDCPRDIPNPWVVCPAKWLVPTYYSETLGRRVTVPED